MTSIRDQSAFPLGAGVTLEQLDQDPHPALVALREREPVSWLPALEGWLVTRYDLAVHVMRDAATYTVDDPASRRPGSRSEHAEPRRRRARAPPCAVRGAVPASGRPRALRPGRQNEADRLIDAFADDGAAELRRSFAGPLAASIMARALGLEQYEVGAMLGWYDAIVAAVTEVTAGHDLPMRGGDAFDSLRDRLEEVIAKGPEASLLGAAAWDEDLTTEQVVSNAAVLLFGGIETTEGMIANALLLLLEHPDVLAWIEHDRSRLEAVLEESLRFEPAAAMVDRYATADVELRDAQIAAGELVRVSISAANRDPAVFATRTASTPAASTRPPAARGHLAFAHGPHVCLGVHLARLEARTGLDALLPPAADAHA